MRHISLYKCTPLAPREDSAQRATDHHFPLHRTAPQRYYGSSTAAGVSTVTAPCIETEGRPGISTGPWRQLADDVLAGESISREQALAVLKCPDDELLDLLSAVYRVRRRWFENQVQLYFLMNAKSGLCPEDCGYCSQSKISEAEIPRYNLLNREKLLDGARLAAEQKARTYCIVISARGPNEREMAAVAAIVPEIKRQYNLKICACLGLLTSEQA